MWIFITFLVVYGISAVLFAFVEPPRFLDSFYKVPSIFVFLPDRWVMPAGRLFLGLGSLGTAIFVALLVLQHS
jgi:hypothetical protein